MKRKITRSSLEQLAKELPVLSEQEQRYYIGGGSGTEQDPYDYEEYRRMSVSGTWMGGYVLCSSELDAPVSEGNSGNVTKSHNASVIYFAKGVKALDDATVIGKRAGSGNVDGGTGSLPSGPRPYWPYRGWSDEYPYDPTIVSGNYPDDQDSSEEGEAWGFSRPKTPKQQSEWDKLNQDLSRYGFKYDGSGDATTKETLRTILETLLGSNSFKDFLSRHQTTTAIPVTIKIGESDMTAYGFTTYGRSPNGTVTIVEKIHPGLLNYSIARHAGIGAAATIIHETIHARLAGALASLNIHPNKIHNETTEDYKIFHSDTFKKHTQVYMTTTVGLTISKPSMNKWLFTTGG